MRAEGLEDLLDVDAGVELVDAELAFFLRQLGSRLSRSSTRPRLPQKPTRFASNLLRPTFPSPAGGFFTGKLFDIPDHLSGGGVEGRELVNIGGRFPMTEKQGDESTLPRLEFFTSPIDRALRQCCTGKLTGRDLLEADFHPATGEEIVQLTVAFLVKQGFDLGGCLVPALFESGFTDSLETITSAASSSLLQMIRTLGMDAISSLTNSKIELRKYPAMRSYDFASFSFSARKAWSSRSRQEEKRRIISDMWAAGITRNSPG